MCECSTRHRRKASSQLIVGQVFSQCYLLVAISTNQTKWCVCTTAWLQALRLLYTLLYYILGMYFLCSWKSPASIVQRCASFFSSHFPTTSWIFNLAISPSVFFSRLASGKSSKSIWRLRPFVYSLDCCFFQQLNAHCNILPDFVLCTTETRCSVEVFLQFFEYPNERVYLDDLKSVVKKKKQVYKTNCGYSSFEL